MEDALGRSNRDVQRVSVFTITDATIQIRWSINDNLTANLIKASAREDISDILRVLSSSPIGRKRVELRGVFPLVDALGNSEDEDVVTANYSRQTLQRINWDAFLRDNVSFGWIGTFDPISPPRISMARLAITSLGIHVCLGRRPRLPHHQGEMLREVTRDDFICSLNDRLCQLGIEFPTARVHRGGSLLDKSE